MLPSNKKTIMFTVYMLILASLFAFNLPVVHAPLTVSTVDNLYDAAYNFPLVGGAATRRSFSHENYVYVFSLENATMDIFYYSSKDFLTWDKPEMGNPVSTYADRGSTVEALAFPLQADFLYDGTYVYHVVLNQTDGGNIKIKKGTPSNGKITWGSWQTVFAGVLGQVPVFVSLANTPDGYFWVAYTYHPAVSPYVYHVNCTKSSLPNSIESWELPVQIYHETVATYKNCAVLPVSSSSVYVIYYHREDYNLFGRTFDGTNVGTEEAISEGDWMGNDRSWAACSDGNNNICVIWQSGDVQIIFLRRRVSGAWETKIETPITPAPCFYNGFSLTATSTTKIYILYTEEVSDPYHNYYYRTWSPEEGFSEAVLVAESENVQSNYNQETCSNANYDLDGQKLIWLWFQTANPYPQPTPTANPLRCAVLFPAYSVHVVSEPELNVKFTFAGVEYTTPVTIKVPEAGTYTFSVKDNFPVVNATPYAFTHCRIRHSPEVDVYSATFDLEVTGDTNITIHYFLGGAKRKPPEIVVEEPFYERCFGLTFYIIMVLLTIVSLYLYAKRELWKISFPLTVVVAWLLTATPCPPWDFYIAISLAVIVVGLLVNKLRGGKL